MNLNQSLIGRSRNRFFYFALSAVSLFGLTDALYLSAEHYFGGGVKCLITEGCDTVLQSAYSQIWGIPVSVFGVLFYAGMFVVINLSDSYKNVLTSRLLLFGSIAGFLVSTVLLYLQIYVIEAICFYCIISFISSTSIFILTLFYLKTSIFVSASENEPPR